MGAARVGIDIDPTMTHRSCKSDGTNVGVIKSYLVPVDALLHDSTCVGKHKSNGTVPPQQKLLRNLQAKPFHLQPQHRETAPPCFAPTSSLLSSFTNSHLSPTALVTPPLPPPPYRCSSAPPHRGVAHQCKAPHPALPTTPSLRQPQPLPLQSSPSVRTVSGPSAPSSSFHT